MFDKPTLLAVGQFSPETTLCGTLGIFSLHFPAAIYKIPWWQKAHLQKFKFDVDFIEQIEPKDAC